VPLDRALGGDAALFYLLVALAMVPRIRRLHRALGVPEAVTRDTCLQVKCMCGNYQRANGGRPGVFDQINWLRYFVDGSLFFRLGRLEYWRKPFNGEYRVFRRRRDGRTIALAGPAWRINDAGWIEGVGAEAESRPGWETVLRQTGAGAFGFPIHPRGFVEREPVRLPAADWDCVLEKGTPVLDLHIPAGGGLTPEACADSFRRAAEFFRRHFPEPAPRAMVCSSWICSPILEQILPPGSNLVAFLREVYLCPLNSRGPASLWFVFLQKPFDPATAPRETSLQRALLAYLESGREWRNGSLFFLLDDLPRFGRQWPRAQYAAADVAAIQRGGSVRQCPDLGSTS